MDHYALSESIPHSYVSAEHRATANLPSIPIPIQYDVLSSSFETPSYSVKTHAHGMSGPYESLQYDFKKQTNEGLKQQCEKVYLCHNLCGWANAVREVRVRFPR